MTERTFIHRGSCHVWISLPEGRLRLTGQDLGGHLGSTEYEYFITVEPEHFDAIRTAVGAAPDADVVDTMCAHADSIYTQGETTWLDSHAIPYEFSSWVH